MKLLLLIALLSAVGAFVATDRTRNEAGTVPIERGDMGQAASSRTVGRVAVVPSAAAARPRPASVLTRHPLVTGIGAGLAVLAYAGLVSLAVRLGAVW
jgi:hypothetical protein